MEKRIINSFPFIAHQASSFEPDEMASRTLSFYQWMNERRSCRDFSDQPVAKEVIEKILLTAGTAPSGAHKQPWTFCVVSDAAIKTAIRTAAEQEEKESYDNRMGESKRLY